MLASALIPAKTNIHYPNLLSIHERKLVFVVYIYRAATADKGLLNILK